MTDLILPIDNIYSDFKDDNEGHQEQLNPEYNLSDFGPNYTYFQEKFNFDLHSPDSELDSIRKLYPDIVLIWELYYNHQMCESEIAITLKKSRLKIATLIIVSKMFLDINNQELHLTKAAMEEYYDLKKILEQNQANSETFVDHLFRELIEERNKYAYKGEVPPMTDLNTAKERWPIWQMIMEVYDKRPQDVKIYKSRNPYGFAVMEGFYGIYASEYKGLADFIQRDGHTVTIQRASDAKNVALRYVTELHKLIKWEENLEG